MDVPEEEEEVTSDSEGLSQGENILNLMLSDMLDDDSDDELDNLISAYIFSSSAFQTSTKQILGQVFSQSSDPMTSVLHTMKVLNNLSGVKMWSPLYIASMAHIKADVTHREAFLAFSDPEDKVCYLEYKTGKKRDE